MFNFIDIETTAKCNRSCSYCPVSLNLRPPEFMTDAILWGLMDRLAAIGFRGQIHPNLYGEPLLDPRIDELIARAKRMGARVHMFTNGDKLTTARLDALYGAGLHSMKVTDHNPKPNPRLAELERYASRRYYAGRFVLRRFGAGDVLHNRGGRVQDAKVQARSSVCFPRDGQRTYVNYDGNVTLCCDDAFGEISFGNAGREPIDVIWEKPEYVKAREGLKTGAYYFEVCQKCNFNAGKNVPLGVL